MPTTPIRIYHNPRCSKSRSACDLLATAGVTAEIVDYQKTPLTREALEELLRLLGLKPLEVIRQGESVFKEFYAGRTLSDEAWMEALLAHPILLERPIVVMGDRAMVARPPEKLLAWLK